MRFLHDAKIFFCLFMSEASCCRRGDGVKSAEETEKHGETERCFVVACKVPCLFLRSASTCLRGAFQRSACLSRGSSIYPSMNERFVCLLEEDHGPVLFFSHYMRTITAFIPSMSVHAPHEKVTLDCLGRQHTCSFFFLSWPHKACSYARAKCMLFCRLFLPFLLSFFKNANTMSSLSVKTHVTML